MTSYALLWFLIERDHGTFELTWVRFKLTLYSKTLLVSCSIYHVNAIQCVALDRKAFISIKNYSLFLMYGRGNIILCIATQVKAYLDAKRPNLENVNELFRMSTCSFDAYNWLQSQVMSHYSLTILATVFLILVVHVQVLFALKQNVLTVLDILFTVSL